MGWSRSTAFGAAVMLLAATLPTTGGAAEHLPGKLQIAAQPHKKTFSGVSEGVWHCVKSKSRQEHGTAYEPAGARQGRATTRKSVGDFVLDFSFDPNAKKITYDIVDKPWFVVTSLIWDGIEEAIERCQ